MTTEEQIAAFIRNKGITKIAEGEQSLTRREKYLVERGENPKEIVSFSAKTGMVRKRSENDLIQQRIVRGMDHLGRSIIVNGLGELIAIE